MEIIVLQQPDVIQTGLHHRVGARFAVFVQQMLFQRPRVHPDADRTAVVFRGLHNVAHPFGIADIAGIDAQTSGPRLRRLDRAFIVEMDVGDDGYGRFFDDFAQRLGAGLIGGGHPHDIGARNCTALNLFDRRRNIGGQGVGHGLN